MQRPLFGAKENRQSTSYNLSFLQSYVILRHFRELNSEIDSFSHWAIMTSYLLYSTISGLQIKSQGTRRVVRPL